MVMGTTLGSQVIRPIHVVEFLGLEFDGSTDGQADHGSSDYLIPRQRSNRRASLGNDPRMNLVSGTHSIPHHVQQGRQNKFTSKWDEVVDPVSNGKCYRRQR